MPACLPAHNPAPAEATASDSVGQVCQRALDRCGFIQLCVTQTFAIHDGRPLDREATLAQAGIGAMSTVVVKPK